MLKCSQVTTVTNHATASPLQSHPFLVSCTFSTIPILHICNLENFYLLFIIFDYHTVLQTDEHCIVIYYKWIVMLWSWLLNFNRFRFNFFTDNLILIQSQFSLVIQWRFAVHNWVWTAERSVASCWHVQCQSVGHYSRRLCVIWACMFITVHHVNVIVILQPKEQINM